MQAIALFRTGVILGILISVGASSLSHGQTTGSSIEDAQQLTILSKRSFQAARWAEAADYLERAIVIWEGVRGKTDPELGQMLNDLGHTYLRRRRNADAAATFERAIPIIEKKEGTHSELFATANHGLGLAYFRSTQYEKAEDPLRSAIAASEVALGPNHPMVAKHLISLAEVYFEKKKYQRAQPFYERAVAILRTHRSSIADLADALDYLGATQKAQGNVNDAVKTFEESLSAYVQHYGRQHKFVYQSYSNLLECLKMSWQENEHGAAATMTGALAIGERILGRSHPIVKLQALELAKLRHDNGDIEGTEQLYQQTLNAALEGSTPGSDEVISLLIYIGEQYESFGPMQLAEKYYLRLLTIAENRFGAHHVHTATTLSNLALLYRNLDNYDKAVPLILRSIAIFEINEGRDSVSVGTARDILGSIYFRLGQLKLAEQELRHALVIHEKQQKPDLFVISGILFNLAEVLWANGSVSEAESLHRRSIDNLVKLGKDSYAESFREKLAEHFEAHLRFQDAAAMRASGIVTISRNFGNSLNSTSGTLASLPFFVPKIMLSLSATSREPMEAIRTIDGILNSLHGISRENSPTKPSKTARRLENPLDPVGQATVLNDERRAVDLLPPIAHACLARGFQDRAERLLLYALQVSERIYGKEHHRNASMHMDLAQVYLALRQPDKALTEAQRAVAIEEKALGQMTPLAKRHQVFFGRLLAMNGKIPEVEQLFSRLLARWEQEEGMAGQSLPFLLYAWAQIKLDRGEYEEAAGFLQRAVAVGTKLPSRPIGDLGVWLENLGRLAVRKENFSAAARYYESAIGSLEKELGKEHPDLIDTLVSMAELRIKERQVQAATALLWRALGIREKVLQRISTESRVTSWLLGDRRFERTVHALFLQAPSDASVQQLLLALVLLQKGRSVDVATLANRFLRNAKGDPVVRESAEALLDIRRTRERLVWTGEVEQPGGAAADKRLREQAEELEQKLVSREMYAMERELPDPDKLLAQAAASLPSDSVLVEIYSLQHESGRRYIGCTLVPDGTASCLELGSGDSIDSTVRQFLSDLRNPGSQPLTSAQALSRLVWKPLSAVFPGRRSVFLSTDGALQLVPFAALHDGQRYLLDIQSFTYLSSGRDLLRRSDDASTGEPIVLAAPDFSATLSTATNPRGTQPSQGSLFEQLVHISPLPGTSNEALLIQGLVPAARVLTGTDASEENLRAAVAPQILHLATHGLFIAGTAAPVQVALGGREMRSLIPNAPLIAADPVRMSRDAALSRSALLLAGASKAAQAPSADADGILTAQEVLELNLLGTELVVLSACDSGVGAVLDGQGVYGLRRAFQVAGAQTVVTSLWQVDDRETADLMAQYYHNLQRKVGRGEAMQRASQRMRSRKPHPFYWAPFIVIGQAGPLKTALEATPVKSQAPAKREGSRKVNR